MSGEVKITRLYVEDDLWQAYYNGYFQGFARTIPLVQLEGYENLLQAFRTWLDNRAEKEIREIKEEVRE